MPAKVTITYPEVENRGWKPGDLVRSKDGGRLVVVSFYAGRTFAGFDIYSRHHSKEWLTECFELCPPGTVVTLTQE